MTEVTEDTSSSAGFTELHEEMNDEMKAKLEAARASGEESVEVKWGFPTGISFVDYATGERMEIKVNGIIEYFPDESAEKTDENIRIMVMETMKSLIEPMSGNLQYDELKSKIGYLQTQGAVMLANEYGIVVDRLNIGSITDVPGSHEPGTVTAKAGDTAGSWTCDCGTVNTGKFCSNCAKSKDEVTGKPDAGWTCDCGTENTGKFCQNCGKPRPNS